MYTDVNKNDTITTYQELIFINFCLHSFIVYKIMEENFTCIGLIFPYPT